MTHNCLHILNTTLDTLVRPTLVSVKEQLVLLLNSVSVPVAVKFIVWLDVRLSGIISLGSLCLVFNCCISFPNILDEKQQCLAAEKYLLS